MSTMTSSQPLPAAALVSIEQTRQQPCHQAESARHLNSLLFVIVITQESALDLMGVWYQPHFISPPKAKEAPQNEPTAPRRSLDTDTRAVLVLTALLAASPERTRQTPAKAGFGCECWVCEQAWTTTEETCHLDSHAYTLIKPLSRY